MTELEQLRKQKASYEDIIDELNFEIEEKDQIIYLLNEEIDDLKSELGQLDVSTLDKQMMFEKLVQNWSYINISDLEAICKL